MSNVLHYDVSILPKQDGRFVIAIYVNGESTNEPKRLAMLSTANDARELGEYMARWFAETHCEIMTNKESVNAS